MIERRKRGREEEGPKKPFHTGSPDNERERRDVERESKTAEREEGDSQVDGKNRPR